MRQPRCNSPRLHRQVTRTDSLRQRCNERNTEEIIRFVRDVQFERQPTLLALQRRAPLPGIGQNVLKHSSEDSGFLEKGLDSTDSEEEHLDNEIVYSQHRRGSRKIDTELINLLTCPPSQSKASNDQKILSRAMANGFADLSNNNVQRTPREKSFVRHSIKRGLGNVPRGMTKQLPPLSRDEAPERPSAPSPSRTPPMSDCSFVLEEPVDFLEM